MTEQLAKLNNADDVKRIQLLWNEYLAANDNYELSYPQQFGNQVHGNRLFGEQKSIPTPAEQLRLYESLVMAEIDDLLQEQDQTREEVYEQDEPQENIPSLPEQKVRDFQLTFNDIGDKGNPMPEEKGRDINQSQELGLTWLKEYQQSKEAGQNDITQQTDQPKQGYDFKLVFNDLDEIIRDDIGLEPEERQKEDMDLEYE